jgi:cytochrome o ubiquinol oxidase subunit 1
VSGFYLAFMPLYVLGLMGVTRRLRVFDDPSLQIWFVIAALGAALIAVGIGCFLVQVAVSVARRASLRDTTGDLWDARTLEWSTSSPPPPYNFAFIPRVHDLDAWWDMKQRGYRRPVTGFNPIALPRNTGAGVVLAALATVMGFALIWHIWWLAALSFAALVASAVVHTFNYDREHHVPAQHVLQTEAERTRLLAARS